MLHQQITDNFVGRRREIQLFEQWLEASDTHAPWILFFYDLLSEPEQKGGVGKTWLLQKCASLARQREGVAVTTIDFFDVAHRDGAEIALRIVQSLKDTFPSWSPVKFETAFGFYQRCVQEDKQVAEALMEVHEALTSDLKVLDAQLLDTQKRLIVFFDTYELIEQNPVIAALSHFFTFPDTYEFGHIGVVIAGRNAPDWGHQNWREREREVQCIPIAPFSLDEIVRFVNEQSNLQEQLQVTSPQAYRLYELTHGRPIMLSLATVLLNHSPVDLPQLLSVPRGEEFEQYLVSLINELNNPLNWVVLYMAHIYHQFNPDILVWLLDTVMDSAELGIAIDRQELWQELLRLAFVRFSGGGSKNEIALHDEMCRLVNKYNWPIQDGEGQVRRELSRAMIEYYDQKLHSASSPEKQQSSIIGRLYHTLYIDRQEGYQFFERYLKEAARRWQNAFARALVQEVKPFFLDFSAAQRYSILLEEAKLLYREENYQAALVLCKQLESQADEDWLQEHQVDLLFQHGENLRLLSQYGEALSYMNKYLELVSTSNNKTRIATVLGRIASIYTRQGELGRAAVFYEESLALLKERGTEGLLGSADILNSLSMVNRLQGDYDIALRRALLAYRIRSDLYQQGRASEVSVARSLGNIGVVYHKLDDLVKAQQYYRRAQEMFERNNYRRGAAMTYNRFGQIELDKNDLSAAMDWFNKAYTASVRFDLETEINSLNKRGWTLTRLNRLNEALSLLQEAIKLAHRIHDYYQEAESMLDVAVIYERQGKDEEAREVYQQAKDIVVKYNYYYLLGRTHYSRADVKYANGHYREAFQHLGEYCYYMALFNKTEYEKAVRKTMERLNLVPPQELPAIIASLDQYWSQQPLGGKGDLMQNAISEASMLVLGLS